MWCRGYGKKSIPRIYTFLWHKNREVKHNESTDGIDVPENFRDLFKDKYLTSGETQSRSRLRIIFNLQQYYKEE